MRRRRASLQSRTARWIGPLVCLAAVMLAAQEAAGFQRPVRTRIANYEDAPVSLREASTRLVQTFDNPNQISLAALEGGERQVKRSRVQYMNRLNQQVPVFLIEGELDLRNHTRKDIAALQITTVFLNAFRERIGTERQSLSEPLRPGQTKQVRWSRALPYQDVFELYLIVTAVRFSDGTVWSPADELILLP
ncbi:MAG: hypothetical protein HY002_21130 [Candidatus Rokubacteria bacterium]|nr:hypothetical protein [Candidatus Rokubacteria bacterium]